MRVTLQYHVIILQLCKIVFFGPVARSNTNEMCMLVLLQCCALLNKVFLKSSERFLLLDSDPI